MIPQRVNLKGFLCYKDEQAIEFDGNATLWMLSGLNGSGKSAIFDAVTYALFGHHRGGGTGAVELINKDSDTMLVEFDFLLDAHLYRAKRTLKRDSKGGAKGTQQMSRYTAGKWVAVEGTGQKREFDAWVGDNVGLSYDTFTSSVLLLQGKAERLIDSKPEGRREVLASIVDLGRYEKLHQKADEKRKALEVDFKALKLRLEALPAVAPLELHEARVRIDEAQAARTTARDEVERWQKLEYEARAYQDLVGRLGHARTRWQKARAVLADAAAIEQAVDRLRELREVLPRLQEVVGLRGQMNQADELIRFHTRDQEKHRANVTQKASALKQAHDKRATLHGQIAKDEQKHREVAAQLRKLSEQVGTLRECERLENDLARLREEVGRLPADPVTLVGLAREEWERLDAVDRQMPALVRFVARRGDLGKAVAQERTSEQAMQAVRARGEALKAEAEQLKEPLDEAARALQSASEQATEARTILAQAKQGLDELSQLDGAKVCRACGQPLTAAHIDDEKRKRGKAVQQAEKVLKQATATLTAARQAEAELRQRKDVADKACDAAREEYRDHQGKSRLARASVEKLQEECSHVWHELGETYRVRVTPTPVADWLTTRYPSDADVDALRVQARELDPARRKLRDAEKVQQSWAALKSREAQALEGINRLYRELPQDRQAVRQQHADLDAQEKALFKSVDACRAQTAEVEKEVERLMREREAAQRELSACEGRLRDQELTLQNAERGIKAQEKALPEVWRGQAATVGLKEMHTLTGEQKHLEEQDTDARGRDLEHARHNLAVLEQEVKQLEKQEGGYAPEARQNPAAIGTQLREAKRVDQERDEELGKARERLALLENYQQQRQQLDHEHKLLEGELQTDRILVDLLGRDRLQLYLVRQAERQVVEYANAVLDRLSGGQLYLKLSGEANGDGASAKALDLEAYNRATGERPINVAFLSGSQKFRVAVSLALGIGQYASKQHRPIESVIIDEGFGCLDAQGRQVMIQELQNLRSQMRCILLVSHQEDFAESFADGYQFKLENGATRVQRFQK